MSDNIISCEVNNKRFVGLINCNINSSIAGFNKSFSFQITQRDIERFNIRVIENQIQIQDEIKLYIDDNLILTGYIENYSNSYTADNHLITLEGRDKTGDLTDSNIIQQNYNIKDLRQLFKTILSDNGYNDIDVINNTSGRILLDSDEKIETEEGETIFDFIDRYCRKGQILARSNAEGNIILERENKNLSIGNLINTKNNQQNNILSAGYNANTQDRYKFIDVYSQANNNFHTEQASNQQIKIIDRGIKRSRRKIIVFNDATTTSFLKTYGNWFKNLKIAKSQSYNCRIYGYYINDNILDVNKIINVRDDKIFPKIDGNYLIQDISFNKSVENGSITDITLVKLGSFSNFEIELEKENINNLKFL